MQACSPKPASDADCLQQIKRLVTSREKDFHRLPYEERLRRQGLYSLRRRRLRGDLIIAYKMLSGRLELAPDSFVFRQCGLAREIIRKRVCRALVGAFEEE